MLDKNAVKESIYYYIKVGCTVHRIHAFYDSEDAVWTVHTSNVSGLAIEAPTLDELRIKLHDRIPKLLEVNS